MLLGRRKRRKNGLTALDPNSPRVASENERKLLNALLAHEFDGADELRLQVGNVHARSGCTCGCGTIDLIVDRSAAPRSAADSPLGVEGEVADEAGNLIGGLLLFVEDGYLCSLEVYAYEDVALPLPSLSNVRWVRLQQG